MKKKKEKIRYHLHPPFRMMLLQLCLQLVISQHSRRTQGCQFFLQNRCCNKLSNHKYPMAMEVKGYQLHDKATSQISNMSHKHQRNRMQLIQCILERPPMITKINRYHHVRRIKGTLYGSGNNMQDHIN